MIEGKARTLGLWKEVPLPADLLDSQQFQVFLKQAGNPTEYLLELLRQYPSHIQVREGIRRWQAGHSPWIQAGWLVHLLRSERDRKEMGNNQTNTNGRG
jgi:hypothetical protein